MQWPALEDLCQCVSVVAALLVWDWPGAHNTRLMFLLGVGLGMNSVWILSTTRKLCLAKVVEDSVDEQIGI